MKNTMTYKGFNAQIMEAVRLRGEGTFELPAGTALPVYHSEAFVSYPESWMRGPGVFVIPVRPDKGLWFNWRMNSEINTAIIPTVKGCNPITGLQTSGFHLEKYETKCPKHGCDFMAERFCPECNYKWPDRNYVSMSPSWLDGFRADDGSMRQFFFSEDELRDIATHMIGKENTVPAFGFAFYSPKEPRIEQTGTLRGVTYGSAVYESQPCDNSLFRKCPAQYIYLSNSSVGLMGSPISDGNLTGTSFPPVQVSYCSSSLNVLGEVKTLSAQSTLSLKRGRGFSKSLSKSADPMPCAGSPVEADLGYLLERSVESPKPVKEVCIGAGAKIRQALNIDSYPLDSWCDTPDAVMTIYFVFQEKFEELKAGGMRGLEGVKNGMLEGIPVG
jgi:hypothetical protein